MTERRDEASDAAEPHTRAPRSWAAFVIAVAAVVIVAVVIFLALRSSNDNETATVTSDATSEVTMTIGSPSGGSPSMGSCLENYDLTTLAKRELALDGVVSSVNDDTITLSVKHWFKGGSSAEISLGGASTLAVLTSAGQPVDVTPGTRLLVSGDGGFAWSCGFTREYRADTAADWAQTLEK